MHFPECVLPVRQKFMFINISEVQDKTRGGLESSLTSIYYVRDFWTNQPAHEIVVLFVFRKLMLQTPMRSHPVGLDVWFLVWPFVYFHTPCVRTTKALARLCGCAGSSEPSLVVYVLNTIISWAGSNHQLVQVCFINFIPMQFFISHYIPTGVFHLQLQGN